MDLAGFESVSLLLRTEGVFNPNRDPDGDLRSPVEVIRKKLAKFEKIKNGLGGI